MKNQRKSPNKAPKLSVSQFKQIVTWLTIIANIAQVTSLGWQIHQDINQDKPQSVELVQRKARG